MSTLSITLNQIHKSYPNGFTYDFLGDLVIISGINGSGKSHLLDIIRQQVGPNEQSPVNATIKLNEVVVNRDDVIFRSFKENLSLPALTAANVQVQANSKNKVWGNYQKNRLNEKDEHCVKSKKSCREAKQKLTEKFGIEKFNAGQLLESEVKEALGDEFIWKEDDIFKNFVGELFYNYAYRVHQGRASIGKTGGPKYDPTALGTPPWVGLNDLFTDLDFRYRFKDNYELNGFEIDEQPQLYYLNDDGTIDQSSPRQLEDLSDGEKAIISFAFASLSGVESEDKKLLLLDEYDAPLNPSLTEAFFKILDTYFIGKGIPVVIVTHSTSTIALAPEHAKFYEVYRAKKDLPRVLQVRKENYPEFYKVHKNFIDQITDQEGRIKEVTEENEKLRVRNENLEKKMQTSGAPLIVTEGKTDWKHLKKALEKLQGSKEYESLQLDFEEYEEEIKMGDGALIKLCENASKIHTERTIICVFDRDSDEPCKKHNGESYKAWGNNVFSFLIPALDSRDFDELSIEHYYHDKDIQTKDQNGRRLFLGEEFHLNGNSKDGQFQTDRRDKKKENSIIDNNVFDRSDLKQEVSVALPKSHFADYVLKGEENFQEFNVDNFRLIFNIVQEILNQERTAVTPM